MIAAWELRQLSALKPQRVTIECEALFFQETLKLDLRIGDVLNVELEAVRQSAPIHNVPLLSYMKLLDVPLGLFMRFYELLYFEAAVEASESSSMSLNSTCIFCPP